jgi:hypothetical protein
VLALVESLKDGDKRSRDNAEWALKRINTPEARKAIEEYEKKSD